MGLPSAFTFVDLETTGTNPSRDRIIEIGVLRVENGELLKTFSSIVNPLIYIPSEIRSMTGITQVEVDRAPLFEEVKYELKELLADSVFVAHNARFDYGFLKSEFNRYGDRFKAKVLCTVKLSRALSPKFTRHNLDELINRFGLSCPNRHRAFDDAAVLWQFFQKAENVFKKDVFQLRLKEVLGAGSRPPNLKKRDLDNLPEGPGVYIFNDKEGAILYIGKSVNLKERIKSHFTNDYLTPHDLKIATEVADIKTIETAGEFGALIREAVLIKKHHPIYNKKLRRQKVMTAAVKNEKEGLMSLELTTIDVKAFDSPENVLGIYKSKKSAREELFSLCNEKSLCPKVLGLEKGKGPCFNYHLGKCKGVCVNSESPLRHNLRFIEAFSQTRIQRWPFAGAITISELGDNLHEKHLVNNWCYLGSVKITEDGQEILEGAGSFDWDLYKIIKKMVRKKSGSIEFSEHSLDAFVEKVW